MTKTIFALGFIFTMCTTLVAQVTVTNPPAQSGNPVLQWNKLLLQIVRTPGLQPATNHSTRSFAMMHLAIYDAVNTLDATHKGYLSDLVPPPGSISQDAAAIGAAHEILSHLYPTAQAMIDGQ